MSDIQIVEQREVLGKEFRMYGDVDSPLFKADDVATWIEHSNVSVMLNSVDESEKQLITIGTISNVYTAWFLTEDGLYEVLMQSRKPIAKEFKKQVKEILRTIRKHGIYATDNVIAQVLENPDFGIKLLSQLKEEREKNKQLSTQVEQDKPKVVFADSVATSKTSILIGDLAKLIKQNGYDIGQNRLFEWLRENRYLIKSGSSRNMPTQKAMEMVLFEVKESTVNNPDGSIRVTKTTKVTGKGQIYFVNLFKNQE
ncbi:MAG: phage antirepressor KilAC domain-containing protein, partial [Enterococcus thailandicus]|nr:phage antirepressor KilAC domain-containing protein [Enterococcus thailandicus]